MLLPILLIAALSAQGQLTYRRSAGVYGSPGSSFRAREYVTSKPSGLPGPDFDLLYWWNFAQVPQLPVCTGDTHCVFQCLVKTDGSAGHCVDNAGADLTGYVEGVSATFTLSYIKNTYGWIGVDDSAASSHIPSISNAAIRAMFAGSYTVVAQGYPTAQVNANGGWQMMITDSVNGLQMRAQSGNVQCLGYPEGNTSSANMMLNGWGMYSCTRTGTLLTARGQGVSGSGVGNDGGAVSGSNALYLMGGVGGCCTTGGSTAGQWVSFTGYNEAKSLAWHVATEKAAYGAVGVQSGSTGSPGTAVGLTGRDDVPDAGVVQIFATGSYITDPSLGIRSFLALKNYAAVDPLAAATWVDVGTPVITSNASAGPFFNWKNTKEGDLITTANVAALDGKRSLAVATSTDGGFTLSGNGPVNCTAYLSQGTAGVTRTKAEFKFITDGTIDAGFASCNVSGLDGTPRRYPTGDGCWAWIDNAKSVKCDLLVGNAPPDVGSVTVYQFQVTPTYYPEAPLIDGTGRGANWPELDGGIIPNGIAKGKIEAVFQTLYSTISQAPNYVAHGTSTYVFDAYNESASHDVLIDLSFLPTYDGGTLGEPSIQALMYGLSNTYENRFDFSPVQFTARTFYVWSYEWNPDTGTLPDGGFGWGCRGKTKIDLCPDPTAGDGGCHATTVIVQNTPPPVGFPLGSFGLNSGNLGTCPSTTDIIDIGTRMQGSNPTSVWVRDLRVYK